MMINFWRSLALLTAFCFITEASASNDLSKRAGTVSSLSGSPVDITSGSGGTYPRANYLSDGSIIGTYTATVNDNHQLTLVHSNDNGASWSYLGNAATRPTNTSDLDNPYVLQIPSGRMLLAYRNHDKDENGTYTFFRITISYSDDGVSWHYLSDPASDPGSVNGNWEPFLRNAQDGSLQLYYSRENSASDQDSLMRTSTDGGQTWSAATTISGQGLNVRDGMVGVATVSGSNLIAVFETSENGLFTVNSITSPDDGKTWGNRQRVYTPTGTNNNAGAPQVVNVGDTMVVSFMTDEDTQLHDWINGAGAKLLTCGDGGSSWGNKLQVFAPQANWPAMLPLNGDDSGFLYFADKGGAKAQKVILS